MPRKKAPAEWVKINDLKPWTNNPRNNEHAIEKVAQSIKRFGFGAPIIARKEDGEIIAGHTRLEAAKHLKLKEVPVRFLDLDPVDAHLLALADNKLGEVAEWDDLKLKDIFEKESFAVDDLFIAGFDAGALDDIIDSELPDLDFDGDNSIGGEELTEADLMPVNVEPISKHGEIYYLGPHRIICGDCRDINIINKLINNEKINLAFTSPPYATQRKYDSESGFKPIQPEKYVDWFDLVQENIKKNMAIDGSWIVNIKEAANDGEKQTYVKRLVLKHVDDWGWKWIEEYMWPRPALPLNPNLSRRFKNGWESVYHFSIQKKYKFHPDNVRHETQNTFKYIDQKLAGKKIGENSQGVGCGIMSPVNTRPGLAFPSNVLSNMGGAKIVGHSAAFPIGLPSFFIKAFTDSKDIVFDPFMGSGTTLIAASINDRIAFGCEISPLYCDLIRRRWSKHARENGFEIGDGL